MPDTLPAVSTSRGMALFARFVLTAVALHLGWPLSTAHADVPPDGRWRQGALREEFTVQQWLPNGCGSPPQTGTSGGGEIVSIRREGDELVIVGGGRVHRSDQCYDQMPTLARETHSRNADGRTWRTRCTTPPSDPRKAILNTLVVASSDTHIDLIETGRYEIVVESGRCVADVKRTRTYDLVREPAATSPSATSTSIQEQAQAPEPKPGACTSPGEPARLEVRPSKKLLRTGESFQFRALVLDAKGCVTGTRTSWNLAHTGPPGISVDANGRVTVASDAPEGVFEITVTAANKDAVVTVEVSLPDRYEDLLARSGLNASGETDAASVVAIAPTSIGAGVGHVEDRAKQRRRLFLAIVGGALVLLAVAAVVLRRRSRRAAVLEQEATSRHEAEVQEVLQRRRIREEAHAAQRRAHEESVAAARAASALPSVMVCPNCTKEFRGPTAFCPNDGTALVRGTATSAPAAGGGRVTAPKRGKICPTCGDRFDGTADYCGKDGTKLVLLN